MLKRVVSSLIGLGIFLIVDFGGPSIWLLAVTIVASICTWEFVSAHHLAHSDDLKVTLPSLPEWATHFGEEHGAVLTKEPPALPRIPWLNPVLAWAGVLFPALTYLSLTTDFTSRVGTWAGWPGLFLLIAVVGVFALRVFRAARHGRALSSFRAFYGWAGMGYIGLLFSSFILIRGMSGRIHVAPFGEMDRGAWLMLYVAFCVWATDVFAYFVGRSLGRHQLAPMLSPKKTVEGSLGGLIGAMLIGMSFGAWVHLPLIHGLAVGAIAGIACQVGDLFESAMKREIGVKDFGNIMPGHGGALDRFDGFLFVAPLAYLYLRLIVGG